MSREFVEVTEKGPSLDNGIDNICDDLTIYAKKYIRNERPLIENIDKRVRDAVLVDVINALGCTYSYVPAVYASELEEEEGFEDSALSVEGNTILSIAFDYFSDYAFGEDIVDSVLLSCFTGPIDNKFEAEEGRLVILDFLNFISKSNEFDRTFTFKDLLDRYNGNRYTREMNQLFSFLNKVEVFERKLDSGITIEELYKAFANRHNLDLNAKSGKYSYNEQTRYLKGRSLMCRTDIEETDRELYALAYAFAKHNEGEKSNIKLIDSKIKEMKRN